MSDDVLVNGTDHETAREKSLEVLAAMTTDQHSTQWLKSVMLPTIGRFVSQQMAPLKAEIAELKLQIEEIKSHGFRYAGVWQRANSYSRGTVVTYDGCMFVAVKATEPAQQPLGCDCWQLAVKSGRDAPRQTTTGTRR